MLTAGIFGIAAETRQAAFHGIFEADLIRGAVTTLSVQVRYSRDNILAGADMDVGPANVGLTWCTAPDRMPRCDRGKRAISMASTGTSRWGSSRRTWEPVAGPSGRYVPQLHGGDLAAGRAASAAPDWLRPSSRQLHTADLT